MKIRDFKLHELGYTYSGMNTLYALTPLEVAFLFDGESEINKLHNRAYEMAKRKAKRKGMR